MKAQDVLHKAAQHMADRAATYDKPEGERSMEATVAAFNAIHGLGMTEAQGWHFMQLLKAVRLFQRPSYHAGSAEDGVAYGALMAEARASESAIIGDPAIAHDEEGRIEWKGGECPLPIRHNGSEFDIIAYRHHREATK